VDHLGKRLIVITVFRAEGTESMKSGYFHAGTICPNCGKGKLSVKAGKRDLGPLLGRNEVIVKNLLLPACTVCGAILVPGDVLELASGDPETSAARKFRLEALLGLWKHFPP
jgi:hypothetical protein